jgi:hypothetical protein
MMKDRVTLIIKMRRRERERERERGCRKLIDEASGERTITSAFTSAPFAMSTCTSSSRFLGPPGFTCAAPTSKTRQENTTY